MYLSTVPCRFLLRAMTLWLLWHNSALAQTVIKLTEGRPSSLRGLSVVSDQVIWASGSNGQVVRSIDGGLHWEWNTVTACAQCDFRDIEAFDSLEAIILKVAEPGILFRTTDGGRHWKPVYTDTSTGIFLDAMAFGPDGVGYAIGDPLPGEHQIYCIESRDTGKSWQRVTQPANLFPQVASGESMFASSGSNLVIPDDGSRSHFSVYAVTGGSAASWLSIYPSHKSPLPLKQGNTSSGANSIAAWDDQEMIVVGGDFLRDLDQTGNCAISQDGGKTWRQPHEPPTGYRSCVTYLSKRELLCCGTSGVDLSTNGGMNWRPLSKESYHVCQKARKGKAVFLAGAQGRIARLQ